MTKKLRQAFEEAARLPEEEQNALGTWILAELAAERRWHRTWSESQDKLTELAKEARAEYRKGETEELDPEQLS
ncbi:MAG: hypothetical protein ACYST0_05065 [Planctomycetota bacterium]|jgi:hypothetical protein